MRTKMSTLKTVLISEDLPEPFYYQSGINLTWTQLRVAWPYLPHYENPKPMKS
jgi:hypothetical protein